MPELILERSAAATWQRVLQEAAERVHSPLDEERESYLVLTLLHYLGRPELVRSVLALRFLDALAEHGHYRQASLREVGDQCLLFAGLFPEQARRRRVSASYFVDLGRSAYTELAEGTPPGLAALYERLAESFDDLAVVLAALRDHSAVAETLEARRTAAEAIAIPTPGATRH